MKMTLAVLALCAFAQSAHATGPDCSAIERTSERLACYDAVSPPKMKKPREMHRALRTKTRSSWKTHEQPLS
jgi:hypothetical protein